MEPDTFHAMIKNMLKNNDDEARQTDDCLHFLRDIVVLFLIPHLHVGCPGGLGAWGGLGHGEVGC